MIFGRRAVAFVNARVLTPSGLADSIRVSKRVLDVGTGARGRDRAVDLDGAFVLPGLVNAHDHLELNHYGPQRGRERYLHADDWIDDMRPRLSADASLQRNARYPLVERLFVGALKNLLAGVTSVGHHNPPYAALRRVPVPVLEHYGWAHSFTMEDQPVGAAGESGGGVAASCRATPASHPFIVHVGEGVDARAHGELRRFAAEGCLRPNSVIVHGVAHTSDTWRAATAAGTSLVWCPASNQFLFGQTVALDGLLTDVPGSEAFVCLGTDSRLTGARDLLDELRCAAAALPHRAGALLPMVTTSAGRILRLGGAGRLAPGLSADLIVVPADPAAPDDAERALLRARRADIRLVMIAGRPLLGDRAVFAALGVPGGPIVVDGVPRLGSLTLARRIVRCPIAEPGVEAVP